MASSNAQAGTDICQRRDSKIAALVSELSAKGPGLVFVRTKAHAKHLAALLQVPYVTSEVSRPNRQAVADSLSRGELQAAVATAAWSTGVNIPALRWVIMPERIKAPIQILQGSGRAMRKAEGKDSYEIINLVDASTEAGRRYGLEREASLVSAGFMISADEMKLSQLLEQNKPEARTEPRPRQGTRRAAPPVIEIRPYEPLGLRLIRGIVYTAVVIMLLTALDRCVRGC